MCIMFLSQRNFVEDGKVVGIHTVHPWLTLDSLKLSCLEFGLNWAGPALIGFGLNRAGTFTTLSNMAQEYKKPNAHSIFQLAY